MLPHSLFLRFSVSFSRCNSTRFPLGFLPQHHVFPLFFNSFTSHTSNHIKGDTFTMSYLIDSCGLSPHLATKLSNGVLILKNPDGPNAVLHLLKSYGFSKTHIAKLVQKHPSVLMANAKDTLLPKLEFFRSIGVSNTDMPKILISCFVILRLSLNKSLLPRYKILRGVVRDDLDVVRALRNCPRCFAFSGIMNDLVPNIEVLEQCGVPQSSISLMIISFPRAAFTKHSKFVEAVKLAKEIGVEPKKTVFIKAIQVHTNLSKAALESKFEVYEKWGWNREMAIQAFRKFPTILSMSEETITKKMSFLVKDMGLPLIDIAKYPVVLGYHLEKRIIPRFSIIEILKSKSLVHDNLGFTFFMCLTEEKFLMKFVIRFQESLPFLPDVYKGLMDCRNVI